MTWNSKVIWSEGMFLQPQHFQQHDRHLERHVDTRVGAVAGYGWGFLNLELDEAALAVGHVALASAQGVFADGTPFDIPGDDLPPTPFSFPADVKDQLVVLAVPLRRPGAKEADLGEGDGLARYGVAETNVPDSNTMAEREAVVQTGTLRLRLMLERDASDAYACLAVARVIERRADNQLVLDKQLIPPTLDVRGNGLLSGYAREIHALLHQRAEALAARLGQPGQGGVAEVADFLFLQTVNRYEPVFAHLVEASRVHPERFFVAALALAGDLATFREARRPPDYPRYHHDDPALCFRPLLADLRQSLSMVLEQNAVPIELQDRKYGVRVATISDVELLRNASFVLAVNAQMPGEALRARFPTQVKIGPVERIRDLVNLQLPGIVLRPLPVVPRQLPYHAGFSYFELETRGNELWKQLERSGGLAMHIAGEFPGLDLEFWAIRG